MASAWAIISESFEWGDSSSVVNAPNVDSPEIAPTIGVGDTLDRLSDVKTPDPLATKES